MDISMRALERIEVLGGKIGREVAPGTLCKLILVPVMGYLNDGEQNDNIQLL